MSYVSSDGSPCPRATNKAQQSAFQGGLRPKADRARVLRNPDQLRWLRLWCQTRHRDWRTDRKCERVTTTRTFSWALSMHHHHLLHLNAAISPAVSSNQIAESSCPTRRLLKNRKRRAPSSPSPAWGRLEVELKRECSSRCDLPNNVGALIGLFSRGTSGRQPAAVALVSPASVNPTRAATA
jgi:hypothetical protein